MASGTPTLSSSLPYSVNSTGAARPSRGASVFLLVSGTVSPFIGWMTGRVGAKRIILAGASILGIGLGLAAQTSQWWHLYCAFGVIASVGMTMAGWLPSIILVRGWFLDRVGMAVGIVSAGIGVGIAIVVPLTQYLIQAWGWRWAFRILAVAIVMWVIPATYFFVRDAARTEAPPAERATSRVSRRASGLRTAMADSRYWQLAGVFFFGNMATQLLFVHQVAYLVDHGVVPMTAAAVGGLAGFSSIVGKILWGSLSDRTGREISYSWALGCLVASLGFLVLSGNQPANLLPYVYAILFGLGYAGASGLDPGCYQRPLRPNLSSVFGNFPGVLMPRRCAGVIRVREDFRRDRSLYARLVVDFRGRARGADLDVVRGAQSAKASQRIACRGQWRQRAGQLIYHRSSFGDHTPDEGLRTTRHERVRPLGRPPFPAVWCRSERLALAGPPRHQAEPRQQACAAYRQDPVGPPWRAGFQDSLGGQGRISKTVTSRPGGYQETRAWAAASDRYC